MRRIKKALAAFAVVCMLSPCISMIVHAASAELRFTDPSTTVGAEVEVTAKLTSSSNLQSLDATLTYDTSMLKFISGDSVSGGDGTLNISGSGSGTTLEYKITFQALAEGNAKVEVSDASGTDASGGALQITKGSSSVTIGPGDPSLIQNEDEGTAAPTGDGSQVEVDGVQYKISNDFTDALIPEGFVRDETTFEGAACQVITQEASGESAMYLVPAEGGDGDFFLYNSNDGSFSPFEEIKISQESYIVLLRDDGSVKLPKQYQKTTFTLNGKDFTAWQDTDNAEYYVMYALNKDGQKGLYQYDTVDKTYQRYLKHSSYDDTADKASPKGLWGKILQFIEDFLDILVIVAIAAFLVLVVVLIVIGVKLHHRNLELDDLYDEYGIDLEDDEDIEMIETDEESENETANQEATAEDADPEETYLEEEQVAEADIQEKDTFADEDEFEDDFVGEDDFGDDFDDDDFDDDFGDDFDDDDFDDDDFGDDDFSDTDFGADRLNDERTASAKEKKQSYEDFDLDFIDLDD